MMLLGVYANLASTKCHWISNFLPHNLETLEIVETGALFRFLEHLVEQCEYLPALRYIR